MIDFSMAFRKIAEHEHLSEEEMMQLMRQIMNGEATPAQIGALLMGLAVKGETVDEIAGAVRVMRSLAIPVALPNLPHVVDTCGTGGDGSKTFNISTAAAFVVAAAGGTVAKHGNRAISSRSGSADVLEAAGVALNLSAEQVANCIRNVGVGFLFAPRHHSATRFAVEPRRELGIRTLFNLLGPLTNPADAPYQVLGVYAARWQVPVAEVLHRLGSRSVLVVHSEDGMDEVSISAPTRIVELKNGHLSEYAVQPEDFGLHTSDRSALEVQSVSESLDKLRLSLRADAGPLSEIVALNAGAALYVSGITRTWKQGVHLAQDVQSSGQALEKLQDLVAFSRACGGEQS